MGEYDVIIHSRKQGIMSHIVAISEPYDPDHHPTTAINIFPEVVARSRIENYFSTMNSPVSAMVISYQFLIMSFNNPINPSVHGIALYPSNFHDETGGGVEQPMLLHWIDDPSQEIVFLHDQYTFIPEI